MRLSIEMYTFSVKGLVLSSFNSVYRAVAGLCGGILAWLQGANRPRVRSEVERQAEHARRNYKAQAMANAWQGPRYYR